MLEDSNMTLEEAKQVVLQIYGPAPPEYLEYLSRKEDIVSPTPVLPHFRIDGITTNLVSGRGIFQAKNFKAFEDDIIVTSFPKTGTTWAQEVVYRVAHGGDLNIGRDEVLAHRFPYLEFPETSQEFIDQMPRPRFIKSHMHYSKLPKDIFDKKCKIIYIARNPKDTVVSVHHFYRFLRIMQYGGSIADMVHMFINNEIIFTPFSKHVKEFWEKRNDENILFLWYEQMHKDLKGEIKRVATFLNKTLTDSQVDGIARHCSFQEMSQNPSTNYSQWDDMKFRKPSEAKFFRKGQVGNWKEHFDNELNQKMDNYIREEFGGTDIPFVYE